MVTKQRYRNRWLLDTSSRHPVYNHVVKSLIQWWGERGLLLQHQHLHRLRTETNARSDTRKGGGVCCVLSETKPELRSTPAPSMFRSGLDRSSLMSHSLPAASRIAFSLGSGPSPPRSDGLGPEPDHCSLTWLKKARSLLDPVQSVSTRCRRSFKTCAGIPSPQCAPKDRRSRHDMPRFQFRETELKSRAGDVSYLAVFAVLNVFLPVEEPVWDFVLARILHNRHHPLDLRRTTSTNQR